MMGKMGEGHLSVGSRVGGLSDGVCWKGGFGGIVNCRQGAEPRDCVRWEGGWAEWGREVSRI